MFETLGKRLKLCRLYVDVTGIKLVELINEREVRFSLKQYRRWESDLQGRIKKTKVLEAIVSVFQALGLKDLTVEWLLNGNGVPPIYIDISKLSMEEKTIYLSRILGDNFKIINVRGSYGKPFVSFGDQIIIEKITPEKCENEVCYVSDDFEQNNHYVGILHNEENEIMIDNFEHKKIIPRKNIGICGRVVWVA
jgi:hypothetical protein